MTILPSMHSLKFNAIVTTFSTMDAQEQADLLRMCDWIRNGFSRYDAYCTRDPSLCMIFKYICDRMGGGGVSKDTIKYEKWSHIRETWFKILPTITGGMYVHKTKTCSFSTQEFGFCNKPGLVDCSIDDVLNEAYNYQLDTITIDGVDLAKMLCGAN